MTSTVTTHESFVHPALFYRTEQEYTHQTVAFLREGLTNGEPMAVAVPGPNLELIRTGLGGDAESILFLDMTEAGRNPGRIIPKVLRGFADAHPKERVRIIGEPIWAGRSAIEYPACAQHEALINAAFGGRAATILCPYDEVRLDPDVIADAKATHPILISGRGRESVSDVYDWQAVVDRYNQALAPAPDAVTFSYGGEDLPAARQFALAQATRLGMTGERLMDVELAVAELTTNSVVHGGGRGTLAIWAEQAQLVCEVRDAGRLTDPLAGRRPPERGQLGGRGLMLVNYVADLVRVHTGDDGTTVRFYLSL
ncbi:anti-sigma factor RsbA family regulatory protein [Streptomyces longwoodensis]|uniref:anti-sigma factor RsbA family regulatory protein n=1 Tax=Streptomyces longwoodensis TaxID=68231 RepID=UPI0022505B99|nr:anti-sigma factor RsbA family regulatory protein [Streptomyces longwoodensis]MCX4996479.1 anti-sigma factor RsbA family regulatory protein [Streptomyces longwoodensis]WRY91170.1 anti-sigma factor RsbA family regulatory protein [Streptomyces longwoodensis]WTI44537.1 anti-sigma factor RsbA family regulatory protein [Streptomyces longwoodensis]WUC57338.1 anti-sigma factor RsbA family regulatory protein [Streptomyces longwoodensis]